MKSSTVIAVLMTLLGASMLTQIIVLEGMKLKLDAAIAKPAPVPTQADRVAATKKAELLFLGDRKTSELITDLDRGLLLDAMTKIESGGRDILGDGGLSRGPLQIQRGYFADATIWAIRHPKSEAARIVLASVYVDVSRPRVARAVVECYMKRYCPEAWEIIDRETIARTHNGGPRGPDKPATLAYWAKIRKEMGR